MPSEAFSDRILRAVHARGYRPQSLDELARALGVAGEEMGDFHAACKALMRNGRVVLGARNAVTLPEPSGRITGTFRGNPRGFGFVIPDSPNSHGDLYIPPGATAGAITGDTVSAQVKKRGKRDGRLMYEGMIVEIVTRGRSRFVGELRREMRRWFVIPDGNVLHVPIVVSDPSAKNARPGDQVVVEITKYPEGTPEAKGVILKVLGERGRPDVETLSIIEQHQLPTETPLAVIEEARAVVAAYDPEAEARRREDLREMTIITIDPVTARDFDDAISVTRKAGGSFELGVHIADVAHFVPEGGALDAEARERGNSVYLPRTVIPMLPEVLSNGVCSLQEGEPRLTKSAFITYDRNGKVKKARFANSIIASAKRLTYEQASAALVGSEVPPSLESAVPQMSEEVIGLLHDMEALARTIHKRRIAEGMIELDLPEIEMVHDEEGHVIDARPADASYSHKIIEMFMVEANEAVARLFAQQSIPAIRRVHDDPSPAALENLHRFLKMLGYKVPEDPDPFDLQRLLAEAKGRPESFTVNLSVLRSMSRAEYAPARVGHYALASKDYTHFTSPIRRYPDLTIHRLLDAHARGRLRREEVPGEADLIRLGQHCSMTERRAEAAEKEVRLVLMLRLLEKHLGDEFDGVVTGVANMGVFVQLHRFLIDGVVRFDTMERDWWEVDAHRGSVIGERTGTRITLGDRMKVRLVRIDVPNRQMELAPAELAAGTPASGGRGKKKKGAEEREKPRTPARRKPDGKLRRVPKPKRKLGVGLRKRSRRR